MPTLKATKTESKTSMGETKTRRELFDEAEKLFRSANGMTQAEYTAAIESVAETGKRHAGMLAKQIDRLIDNLVNSDEPGSVINSSCGSVDGVTDRTEFYFVGWREPIVDAEPMPVTETVLGDDENGRYRVRDYRPIRCEPFEVIHENTVATDRQGNAKVERIEFNANDWTHEQFIDAILRMEPMMAFFGGNWNVTEVSKYRDERPLLGQFNESDILRLVRLAGFREPYEMADSMPVDTPTNEPRAFSVGRNTGGSLRYLSSDEGDYKTQPDWTTDPNAKIEPPVLTDPLYGQGAMDAVAWRNHYASRSVKAETDREPIGHVGYVGSDARIVRFGVDCEAELLAVCRQLHREYEHQRKTCKRSPSFVAHKRWRFLRACVEYRRLTGSYPELT